MEVGAHQLLVPYARSLERAIYGDTLEDDIVVDPAHAVCIEIRAHRKEDVGQFISEPQNIGPVQQARILTNESLNRSADDGEVDALDPVVVEEELPR